jgi:hypothetical protein
VIPPESKGAKLDDLNLPYSSSAISRLVEAGVWKGRSWVEVEGAWADQRAEVERTGDLERFIEVLDLETAIASLKGNHPQAAVVVVAHLHGMTREDLSFIRNYDRLLARAKAYLLAFLAGDDPDEAYRRAHRRIA